MIVLGLNMGMGASVCLLADGTPVFAVQEERLCRVKNYGGFPDDSLAYLCENYHDEMAKLDVIAFAGVRDGIVSHEDLARRYHLRFENWRETTPPRGRTPFEEAEHLLRRLYRTVRPRPTGSRTRVEEDRAREVLSRFDIDLPPTVHVKHHLCHAASAYYGLSRTPNDPYLLLTLDGGGDGEAATVSIGRHGRIEAVASTGSHTSIGHLYSNITYMLGLKAHEHEYKVMGLAPYVPARYGNAVREILSRYVFLDESGLNFARGSEAKTSWVGKELMEDLRFHRFDNIASGLQQYTEELILEWVRNCIRHTGVQDLLLSGGVFMNVKVNQRIASMPEVRSVDVFPSCGDETNSFGAAFHAHFHEGDQTVPVFDTFCLGPAAGRDLEEAKERHAQTCTFERLPDPSQAIAELLAAGNIVARCSGPMEFGARALGNRSILADPSVDGVVEEINYMIKHRDFWMPFAPAVRFEDVDGLLKVPDGIGGHSPYMMFAFDTQPEAVQDMRAGLHRADKTARAQIVESTLYPEFHEILTHFRDLTGRAALLNTSFNMHGEPIVSGAVEAIDILHRTSLEYLVVDDWLIRKVS